MKIDDVLDAKVAELDRAKIDAELANSVQVIAKGDRDASFIRRVKAIASGADLSGDQALLIVGQLREAIRQFDEPERAARRVVDLRAEIDRIRGGLGGKG